MSVFFGVRKPLSTIPGADENTLLLLHGDESPLIDSSPSLRTLSLNGGIARDATESKFGGYSIRFDGSNDYIQLAADSDLRLIGDFTIDFWANHDSGSGTAHLYSYGQEVRPGNYLSLHVNYDEGRYQLRLYSSSTGVNLDISVMNRAYPGGWHHFAVMGTADGNSSVMRFALNGTLLNSDIYYQTSIPDTTVTYLGYPNFTTPGTGKYLQSYIDEFRISNKVRWTTNFTPPTQAYSYEYNGE